MRADERQLHLFLRLSAPLGLQTPRSPLNIARCRALGRKHVGMAEVCTTCGEYTLKGGVGRAACSVAKCRVGAGFRLSTEM